MNSNATYQTIKAEFFHLCWN